MNNFRCPSCDARRAKVYIVFEEGIRKIVCKECLGGRFGSLVRSRHQYCGAASDRYLTLEHLSPIQRIQTMQKEFGRYWFQFVLDPDNHFSKDLPFPRRHTPFSFNLEAS